MKGTQSLEQAPKLTTRREMTQRIMAMTAILRPRLGKRRPRVPRWTWMQMVQQMSCRKVLQSRSQALARQSLRRVCRALPQFPSSRGAKEGHA